MVKFLFVLLLWSALSQARLQAMQSVTLAWNPVTNAASYNLYYGSTSHIYTNIVSTGNVTNITVSNLVEGGIYYFAATARTVGGLESALSGEIIYTVPIPPGFAWETNTLFDHFMGTQGKSNLSTNWSDTGNRFKIRDTIGVVGGKLVFLERAICYSNVPYLTNVALVNTNDVVQSIRSMAPMPPIMR